MAVNSISPGSYNSPSVQTQAQTQHAQEKRSEVKTEETYKSSPPERAGATLNTRGQTIGTIVNTKA